METQSDRLHPRSPICDADKRPISLHRSSWDRQGWAYSQAYGTLWDGIRAKIILFSQSRRFASGGSVQTLPQSHEPDAFWITNHDSAHRGQKSRPASGATKCRMESLLTLRATRVWRQNEAM